MENYKDRKEGQVKVLQYGVKVTLGESNGGRGATKLPGVRTLLYMPTRRAPFLASSSFSESVLKTSLCQSFVRAALPFQSHSVPSLHLLLATISGFDLSSFANLFFSWVTFCQSIS